MNVPSAIAIGFIGGMIAQLLLFLVLLRLQPRKGKRYPRKTTEPDLQLRSPDLPTNSEQPASRVTQAQFRARRETRD